MKCTTCGYETQPGARFCVQCGTTLPAEPVPVAAAAAAAATPVAPSAPAAAAQARPAASSPSATIPPRIPAAGPPAAAAAAAAPPPAAPSVPVASGPPKLGMIAAMLALIAVLAIGGFVAYRMSLSKDTAA
jgi:hypothetical protein